MLWLYGFVIVMKRRNFALDFVTAGGTCGAREMLRALLTF